VSNDRWITLRHGHGVIGVVVEGSGHPDHIEDMTPERARALASDLIRRADEVSS
jgi:hypothetical protein